MLISKIKIFSSLCLYIFLNNMVSADSHVLELNWELDGLSNPESVIYDQSLNHLYVSNVNGSPIEKDANGFISIVSLSGKIIQEKWVIGVNAPKGLALHGRTLYTADIDELVAIDIDSGRIINKFKVDDAKFLNDVTASENGDVYVSDMALDRIHILTEDNFSIWSSFVFKSFDIELCAEINFCFSIKSSSVANDANIRILLPLTLPFK